VGRIRRGAHGTLGEIPDKMTSMISKDFKLEVES